MATKGQPLRPRRQGAAGTTAAPLVLMMLLLMMSDSQPAWPAAGRLERVRLASASPSAPSSLWPSGAATAAAAAADSSPGADQKAEPDNQEGLVGAALRLLQANLPLIDLNYTLNPHRLFLHRQLDAEVEDYYRQRFAPNTSLEELQLLSVKAALRMAPMPLHTSWGYADPRDLALSSQPVHRPAKCAAELARLSGRLDRLLEGANRAPGEPPAGASAALHRASPVENLEAQLVYRSTDLQFLRYLDTFGKAPSDFLRGSTRWFGSYQGCLDTKLAWPADQPARPTKMRYCLAALKSVGWPGASASQATAPNDYGIHSQDFMSNNYFIRVGVCLPESCDSSALRQSADSGRAIERLLKFNLVRPFHSDRYYLSDLYCLPDERSPVRALPPLGWLLLAGALGWLALVGLATTVHLNVERFYTKAVKRIRARQAADRVQTGEQAARLRSSSPAHELADASQEPRKPEFREADILGLKEKWIRLNVRLWDLAGRLVEGVDLIGCLSLYSNWLQYTRRLTLAVTQLHARELRRERIRLRNRQLVEGERRLARPAADQRSPGRPQGQQEPAEPGEAERAKEGFARELNRRCELQDDLDDDLDDERERRVDTSALNALKVVALGWIIAAHCIFYLGSAVGSGALLMNYMRDLLCYMLAYGAMHIVELFFLTTGCLTAYLAFKRNTYGAPEGEHGRGSPASPCEQPGGGERDVLQLLALGAKKLTPPDGQPAASLAPVSQQPLRVRRRMLRPDFWLLICAYRYLRIVPTYLVVYAFVKLVGVYVGGAGPTWDYAVSANSLRRKCVHESWLPVLTLTSNFSELYGHCVVGGWYLSTDMQCMVAAVPLLMLLARCQQQQQQSRPIASDGAKQQAADGRATGMSGRLAGAYALVGLLALLSALASIAYGLRQARLDLSYILKFVPHTVAMLSENIAMYTNSVFRFRAFALGLLLGHALYLYELRLLRLPKWLQQHGAKVCTLTFLLGFGLMFFPVLYPQGRLVVSHDWAVLLTLINATGIDLFLCALIFLACIGKAPKLALFLLNSPFWTLLSSLSLCAFLVHAEVIVVLTSLLDPPPTVAYSVELFVFSAALLITYALALALHLAFEMPVGRLTEAIMRKYLANAKAARPDEPRAASTERARRCR